MAIGENPILLEHCPITLAPERAPPGTDRRRGFAGWITREREKPPKKREELYRPARLTSSLLIGAVGGA